MLSTILLRDADGRGWFEYSQPVDVLSATTTAQVLPTLQEVERRVHAEQLFAAGFVTYEAACGFDASLPVAGVGFLPLLCFGLFKQRSLKVSLAECAQTAPQVLRWQNAEPKEHYQANVRTLRAHIGAGETYQVNYTTRLDAQGVLDLEMFQRIGADAPFGAFLDGPTFSIVSASPEMFFTRHGQNLVCKPMKGTASRGLDSVSDQRQAQWLAQSTKNRAENLMITDMVRNDLGRIAKPGSVNVPALFDVEQYPTVWQMTSTVTAQSRHSLADIFCALFPGASITGAPKKASMAFINQLEGRPREIYTGAIGVIEPSGDARFSIAIRTAWSNKVDNTSHYGAGGGIVWDSNPLEEYAELLTKTAVLNSVPAEFELLETMRWTPQQGLFLAARHLQRLSASASYFGFVFDEAAVNQQLCAAIEHLAPHPHRLRLSLARSGEVTIVCTALDQMGGCQSLALAKTPVNSSDKFLYHKTTCRQVYDNATSEVAQGYEALLFNEFGFVTESAIANLAYRLHDVLYTPPVKDGLLPGTLRAELLQRGELLERSLHVDELASVEALYLINALRGRREACLS